MSSEGKNENEESLVRRIQDSHSHPDDNDLQQQLMNDCFTYFLSLPETDHHLFCEKNKATILVYLLLVLASFNENEVLEELRKRAHASLDKCTNCVIGFHAVRADFREKFINIRKISFQNTNVIMERLAKWEADYLSSKIRSSIDTPGDLSTTVTSCLVECMIWPRLLRMNSDLKSYFDHSFPLIDTVDRESLSKVLKFYPGLIYCLFEGSSNEREWALSKFPYGDDTKTTWLESKDFNPLAMEEYEEYFYRIQDPDFYTDQRAVDFWCSINPILRFCDPGAILKKLQYPPTVESYTNYVGFNVVPLTQVFINQSLSYLDQPLPYLLRTLAIFLERLGNQFFTVIKPHSYLTFFDIAFQNPAYLKTLASTTQDASNLSQRVADSGTTPHFRDLFRWMTVCYPLLKESQKAQFACIIFNYMMNNASHPSYGNFFCYFALNMMSEQLDPKNALFDAKLTFEMITNSKARSLVDKRCIVIFDAIKNSALRVVALKLIKSALMYDVALLVQSGYSLSAGDSSVTLQTHPDLWNILQTKLTGTDVEIATTFLSALQNAVAVRSIDILYLKTRLQQNNTVPEDDMKKLVATCSKHNKYVGQWNSSVESILSKIVEYSSTQGMQSLARSEVSSVGIWSCVLSPEEKVYQSGISFLYEAFNVDGRFEAFREALKQDIPSVLKPFSSTLIIFVKLEIFKASKRGVRIIMDLIKALFDPIHGLLAMHVSSLSMKSREVLVDFWEAVWRFLRMIYRAIFVWSSTYERLKVLSNNKQMAERISSDLLEFTRDVLDLSHSVLNGYKLLVSAISFDGIKEEQLTDIQESIFQPVMSALKDEIMWLRLSDPALLVLCVNLIINVLDLSMELKVKVSDENIANLTKLCAKAKKYNNRMNKEQTGNILLRTRSMNAELVENILAAEEQRKREKAEKNNAAIRRAGRISSNKYVSPTVIEIPDVAPPRLTLLEQARLRLNEKRKRFKQPAKEPAAARPPGFNKKHSGSASNSEEDDDDNDDDDDDGGLFTKEQVAAKLKRSKATLSSIQHRRPAYSVSDKQAMIRETMNKKKKAEELMRLRLNVDMNPFYKHVLSWSYEHSGDFPVDSNISGYKVIADEFDTAEDYQKTFEPLLLLECWQGIQRAKQVGGEKPFRLTVASRSATDSFYDVYSTVDKKMITEQRLLLESDLMALMFVDNLPSTDKQLQRRHVSNRKCSCFARVRNIKISNSRYAELTLRISSSTKMVKFLSPSTEIVGMRVMQMTTVEREYSSLVGLPYYDLVKSITKAVPCQPEGLDSSRVAEIKGTYDVNDSQAVAIAGAVHKEGFSLIQGPPGTGKTKTILGVIGHFLTRMAVARNGSHPIQMPSQQVSRSKEHRRILVCAPSNAAVDELVLRLMRGIKNSKGVIFKPRLVRLGRTDAINEQVKGITLEELVDSKLSSVEKIDDNAIREQHRKCIMERDELREKLDSGKLPEAEIAKAEMRLQDVVQKRRELGKKLDEIREKRSVSYRNREIERRNIQFKILNDAEVVCSTLSGSAHDVLASMSLTFDTVVIDEAAQCTELSAIIPLRYGCTKCVMVGDPNQLPPTVLSQKAASYKYEQSLFVRIQNNHKDSVYLLNVQYRMHPEISMFPSKEFYHSRLLDGPNMAENNSKPWNSLYGPYRFFDVKGAEEQNEATKSVFNYTEASLALELVEDLFEKFSEINWAGLVGIISPYKEQVKLLKKLFINRFGRIITTQIDFNTVDGFQGQEKEVIVFSCVRAENHTGIGFLADIRRMNVALTRARSSLWILGSKKALVNNKTWRDLIENATERHLVERITRGFTKSNTANLDTFENYGQKPVDYGPKSADHSHKSADYNHKSTDSLHEVKEEKENNNHHLNKQTVKPETVKFKTSVPNSALHVPSGPHTSLNNHKRSHGYLSGSKENQNLMPPKRVRHGIIPSRPHHMSSNGNKRERFGTVSDTGGMFKLSKPKVKFPPHMQHKKKK